CGAVMGGPPHEPVDRHRRVGADSTVGDARHVAAARPNDEAVDAAIRDEHVRSAAEQRHPHALVMGDPQRPQHLVAAAGLDQPARRTTDVERRERRERRVRTDAIDAERDVHRRLEGAHTRPASTAISVRSCAISAAIASRMVQTLNEIVSPGPSWPTTGMSAAITVAIFGYPPAVCRSAISRIGSPDAGTWRTPSGVASEMMSAPRTCDSGGPARRNPIRSEFCAMVYGADCSTASALEAKYSVCGPGSNRTCACRSGSATTADCGSETAP